MSREMASWKRLMDKTDRELNELDERQKTDTKKIMKTAKSNYKSLIKANEVLTLQAQEFDAKQIIMQKRLDDHSE